MWRCRLFTFVISVGQLRQSSTARGALEVTSRVSTVTLTPTLSLGLPVTDTCTIALGDKFLLISIVCLAQRKDVQRSSPANDAYNQDYETVVED
ncbi:hypothetical protein J6590_054540 [Homalodisca vitripennis]|nr:hypothetical protein J6590_054540 [Homalodisca vitripennis]